MWADGHSPSPLLQVHIARPVAGSVFPDTRRVPTETTINRRWLSNALPRLCGTTGMQGGSHCDELKELERVNLCQMAYGPVCSENNIIRDVSVCEYIGAAFRETRAISGGEPDETTPSCMTRAPLDCDRTKIVEALHK